MARQPHDFLNLAVEAAGPLRKSLSTSGGESTRNQAITIRSAAIAFPITIDCACLLRILLRAHAHHSVCPPICCAAAVLETVLFSSVVTKINRKDKAQDRVLVVTNLAVYNMSKSKAVKRRIELGRVEGITLSTTSDEFVIHCPSEYDYRLTAVHKREAIESIQQAKAALGQPDVTIQVNAQVQLKEVTVTRVLASLFGRRSSVVPPAGGGAAGGAAGGAGAAGGGRVSVVPAAKPASAGDAVGSEGGASGGAAAAGAGAGAAAPLPDIPFEPSAEIGDLTTIEEGDEDSDSD